MNKQSPIFCYYFLFLISIVIFQNNLFAQSVSKSYNIPAFNISQYDHDGRQVRVLSFDNSNYYLEYPTLPSLWDKIEVNHLYSSYKYTIENIKYESLTLDEVALIPAEYAYSEPRVVINSVKDENRHYAMLRIIPLVKNASGQYRRLVSCDIRFEGENPVRATKMAGLRNSVLASGTWYKIAVKNTGMHKVTYNDLKELGISMSGLRAANIALFGNGGGMIHDVNPVEQIDDLLETPIMMMANANGVFDENSYFVFYAQGPHSWDYLPSGKFSHKFNIYSEEAYYFINVSPGIGEKKRIERKSFLNQTANSTATHFIHYDFYEKDVFNFEEAGREWFDEAMSVSTPVTYNFTLPEMYDNNSGTIKIRAASTSTTSSRMELSWGNHNRTLSFEPNSGTARFSIFEQNNLPFSSGKLDLTLKFISSQTSSMARLDYIEIQAKCKLRIIGNAMPFALTENVGASNIAIVNLSNASSQTMVWDVTDHNAAYAMQGVLSGEQFTFHTPVEKPRKFVAFNGTEYKSVATVGKVENQNLHGFNNVDMVIVSHSDFLPEANRLAKFRNEENNLIVKVVTPAQIYNEFSSGAQDPIAIRNFMRYLYDNDAQTIKYLLLFGRPTYDYRGLASGTKMFVPNFQAATRLETSLDSGNSCDDFFGILGINQGDMSGNMVNIGVGRFSVTNSLQAKIAVDKTINASVRKKLPLQNASQISNMGDWRNVMTFVTDDYDGTDYMKSYGEVYSGIVASNFPTFNLEKIYSDAYPLVSNAGGQRYPGANQAINTRMEKGTLVIGYFGHGGGNGWSHERILEIVDINNWKNKFNQPLMITLTCSFGWYDKPATSPAEFVFLNENGGASALLTTSRAIGIPDRFATALYREIGSKYNNRYKTLGEINRFAINNSGGTTTNVNAIYLMGDPAMVINIPNQNVKTDKIFVNDPQEKAKKLNPVAFELVQIMDTIKALSKVTVNGRITDDAGNTLTNFNGNIFPSIFDKAVKQKELGQKPRPDDEILEFMVQKNIVFKGNATVTNGVFEFSFYVPKDINFEYGKGKISYYAVSTNDDAGGYYDNFIIGGMSDNPITDEEGPEISIFLNDEKFVPGGITNPDPVLILKLKDEYGINTTGNGIGHDIVAILDNNIEKQMVLNDYYLADQDSYNSGTVRYPLQNLSAGAHTLKVRAWDIFNNPSEASIDFVVKTDTKLLLAHVLNYPNPFTTKTAFYFEHNQPAETFDILIHIFTVSGKLVNTLQSTQFLEGNRSFPIDWDGRDQYGDKIGKGVYIYRLTVRNSQGEVAEKIEKIAIL